MAKSKSKPTTSSEQSKAKNVDAHGYYINPNFYEHEIGEIIKELLEANNLLKFLEHKPSIYEDLCQEIFEVGIREEDDSIVAMVGGTEIKITEEIVSEVYGIPTKSKPVRNIWDKDTERIGAHRLENVYTKFFKIEECNFNTVQDKHVLKPKDDDFKSTLMDIVNKAIDGKQSSFDQMGTNEWKQMLSLFVKGTNWCVVLLHNFSLESSVSSLKFKKQKGKPNLFKFMSGILEVMIPKLNPPLPKKWLTAVSLSETRCFNKKTFNLKQKKPATVSKTAEEVDLEALNKESKQQRKKEADQLDHWHELVYLIFEGRQKRVARTTKKITGRGVKVTEKDKKVATDDKTSFDSHNDCKEEGMEGIEVDPNEFEEAVAISLGKKKRKGKKISKGKKKKKVQEVSNDSERTLSDSQDKDEEKDEDVDSHDKNGQDEETTDSYEQMAVHDASEMEIQTAKTLQKATKEKGKLTAVAAKKAKPAAVPRMTRSQVLPSTKLSSLSISKKRKGGKIDPKPKKTKQNTSPSDSTSQKDKSSSDHTAALDGLLNLQSNEPESVEKDQQSRGNLGKAVVDEQLLRGNESSESSDDEPNENLIKAIQYVVLDGNPDTEKAVKLHLENEFSESQIKSAIKFLRSKYGERVFKGPGQSSFSHVPEISPSSEPQSSMPPIQEEDPTNHEKTPSPIIPTNMFPPQIPSIPESEFVEGQVVTTSDSDNLKVAESEKSSSSINSVSVSDSDPNQKLDLSQSHDKSPPIIAGLGQDDSHIETVQLSDSHTHMTDSYDKDKSPTPSPIPSPTINFPHVHSPLQIPFDTPKREPWILSCGINFSIPSITAAKDRFSELMSLPEIINPFFYPKVWELTKNGMLVAARNLAGLAYYAYVEWKEFRIAGVNSFIQKLSPLCKYPNPCRHS